MPTPVLLLHGVPADARLWTGVQAHLTDTPTLAPDLPGYGGGPDLQPPTVAAHVTWLLGWLDRHAPADPVHVVGQDYGGLLGARLAIHAPDRVRSLTLVSAPIGLGWAWAHLGALPGPHLLFYRAFGGGLWHHQGVRPDRRAAFAETFGHHRDDPTLPERMRAMARAMSLRELAQTPRLLRATGVPLLTLNGTADRFVSAGSAIFRAARHRRGPGRARTTLLAGGRHYLPFDRPRATAQALVRFFDDFDQPDAAAHRSTRR